MHAGRRDAALAYFESDDLDRLTRGNGTGLVTDFVYHPTGPIDTITVGNPSSPLHKLDYAIDGVLNVDTIQETIAGTVQSPLYDFDYDAVYRLTDAAYPTGPGLPTLPESFGYDAASNRDDNPASATPWSDDANNRIEASPGSPAVAYVFDAAGGLRQRCKRGRVRRPLGPSGHAEAAHRRERRGHVESGSRGVREGRASCRQRRHLQSPLPGAVLRR